MGTFRSFRLDTANQVPRARLRLEENWVLEVASLESRTRFAVASRAAITDLEPEAF